MKHDSYNEQRERGNFSFPVEYHYVTNHHPRYNMPYHWHIQYEIIRVLEGKIVISIDENEYTASAGDIIFITDGCVHGGKAFLENTIYECMVFDKKLFETNVGDKNILQKFFEHHLIINSYFNNEYTDIHRTIWTIFDALKTKSSGYEFIVLGCLFNFFGLVLKHNLYTKSFTNFISSNQKNIHKLKKVFHLIETSYSQPLTLEDLANTSGLSPKYFCRFFQGMTNKTPIAYLNYYRIECACSKLISDKDQSITDIAYSCGFNDLSYFIKTFRKYKNTTPNKYIKSYFELTNK